MTDCVIVRASGKQLDHLREEASRIARQSKIDWSIERGAEGAHFCFEDAESKKAFVTICEGFAIPHREA
ncbi:hypothetical protein ACVWW6_000605 [Bradyrhizobium sp. USDA 3311]|uniref:hypothetical protein n=1 Tax=Bradyrhizobium sp. LCT2 TaxID=2493093 RepID=UPI0013745613|nr:hypothetical protein [Bradyrhizobium sp. LCT2]QHP67744.1 hypothetical protein EI171_10120 [Bradyrhizobium sp. LCT2]